jgi:hypothetical protein
MTDPTLIIDDLKPVVEPFDPEWSTSTLATILAEPLAAPPARKPRRFLLALPLAAAVALGVALLPSLMSGDDDTPGASAAASEVLTNAADALEDQAPGPDEYLHVKTTTKTWIDGKFIPSSSRYEDWVPGDRSRPMVEQSWESGRIHDTNAIGLREYATDFYANYPTDPRELLDALNQRAIDDDSDSGNRGKNIWDQAFRELQGAAVPVTLKAAIFDALTELQGVRADPAGGPSADEATALSYRNDPVSFLFDAHSGVFLGMSLGFENPVPNKVQWIWTFATEIVPTAPKPDNVLH